MESLARNQFPRRAGNRVIRSWRISPGVLADVVAGRRFVDLKNAHRRRFIRPLRARLGEERERTDSAIVYRTY